MYAGMAITHRNIDCQHLATLDNKVAVDDAEVNLSGAGEDKGFY